LLLDEAIAIKIYGLEERGELLYLFGGEGGI